MTRLGIVSVAVIAAAICFVGAPTPASAQKLHTIKHRTQKGDTLELLAAEYYGDRNYAVFIMKANGMTHPEPLRPNRRLRIPIQREITAAVGDTLTSLAEQHLADPRRSVFLADFNSLDPNATVAAGQRIVIPFHVTHRAANRETIGSIAAAYFGTSKKASLLRAYNFLDDNAEALEPGQTLVVPIYNVRVRRSKLPPPDAESQEREARLLEMEEKASLALPRARSAWRDGNYTEVKRLLIEIDLDYLSGENVPEIGVLLGGAYVAFHDKDSAVAVFERVLRRQPNAALDDYHHSPIVRELWKKAGGTVNHTGAE